VLGNEGVHMTIVRLSSGLIMWSQPLACEHEQEQEHVDVRRSRFFTLTMAEVQVCLLAMRGLDNPSIAAFRGTSPRTVAVLMARVFCKLRIGGRSELIAKYAEIVPAEVMDDGAPGDRQGA
jgi:DNA-binding CsgD family transcriptional regulator